MQNKLLESLLMKDFKSIDIAMGKTVKHVLRVPLLAK